MSFGVRVFDTVLNSRNIKDTVTRNSSSFWKEFCAASRWSFSYERVHSLTDLKYFLSRTIKEDFIIFSGHGDNSGWHMTNGDILSAESSEEIKLHKNNTDKNIIFSSCLIANNEDLCQILKDNLHAKRLFAYKHEMLDAFCFLNESILLNQIEQVEKNKGFTTKDFAEFQQNTNFMKNLNQKHVRSHPMKMFD